jgi:hypothetical protein
MKILFLDHDGVICLSSEWGSRFKNKEGLDSVFDRFNEKAVRVLNQIIESPRSDEGIKQCGIKEKIIKFLK